MYYNRRKLEHIAPAELDNYLAKGWYRTGQSVFTTQFLFFEQQIFTAVWIRLQLKDYQFKKSLRKIKRKAEHLRIEVKDAEFTAEKEKLFDLYKSEFKGDIYHNMRNYMLDHGTINVFNTKEVNVYDGDRLIGYSFFDCGKDTLSSIMAAYLPEYKQYSLGMLTMLEEIQYGIERNYDWYYPGYFVPGNSRFDYKCRIGDVEYYEFLERNWKPIDQFKESTSLSNQLSTIMAGAYVMLVKTAFDVFIVNYKNFELGDIHPEFGWQYHHPLVLMVTFNDDYYIIEYNLFTRTYQLSKLFRPESFRYRINDIMINDFKVIELYNFIHCDKVIGQSRKITEIIDKLNHIQYGIS